MSTESKAPWPSQFAKPTEILAWLNTLKTRDGLSVRCLLGMRWLVLAELERSAPEEAGKPPSGVFGDEPPQTLAADENHARRYR